MTRVHAGQERNIKSVMERRFIEFIDLLARVNYPIILKVILITAFLLYVSGLFRVWRKERSIKKLDRDEQEEIRRDATAIIREIRDRQIAHIKSKYKPERDKIERDRRFILEKLPFFRK